MAAVRNSRTTRTGAIIFSSTEYFHGDNGAGLGASHQTGWTGLVATAIQLFGRLDGPQLLEAGRAAAWGDPGSGT